MCRVAGKGHELCAGLATVLSCVPSAVKVNIYGMNWTRKIWEGHRVEQEAAYVSRLEQQGRVQVNCLLANHSTVNAAW